MRLYPSCQDRNPSSRSARTGTLVSVLGILGVLVVLVITAIKGGNLVRRGIILEYPYTRVTIFSDSQAALRRAQGDHLGPGQAIAIEIIAKARELTRKKVKVTLKWVPSHIGIEGNERADL